MTEEKILRRLLEIERDLSTDPINPAYKSTQGGVHIDIYSPEADEIIKIIGNWYYEKRQNQRKELEAEKAELKKQLLKTL